MQTLINKPFPLNRNSKRDPNIQALKRRGFINHGSTLFYKMVCTGVKGLGVYPNSFKIKCVKASKILHPPFSLQIQGIWRLPGRFRETFRVQGIVGFRVWGLRDLGIQGFRDLGIQGLGVWGLIMCTPPKRLKAPSATRFRVQGLGFRVSIWGYESPQCLAKVHLPFGYIILLAQCNLTQGQPPKKATQTRFYKNCCNAVSGQRNGPTATSLNTVDTKTPA